MGSSPTATQAAFHLENNAVAVATLNDAIAAHTPEALDSTVTLNRVSDGVAYRMTTVGYGAPAMNTFNTSTMAVIDSLEREPLGDNVWLFTDTYTQDSTDYRDFVVMSYDPALTGTDQHYWGLWMRQQTDTVAWDRIDLFNYRSKSDEAEPRPTEQNALEGSFTFTGGALGVYTKGGTAGWFSADARMTANFGGASVDAANRFTMTGTIDDFVLSSKEINNWSVTLTGAPGKNNAGIPTDAIWTGTAAGGGAQNGAFRALFMGPTSAAPSSVRGTFIAHFNDGRAAGAFNATGGGPATTQPGLFHLESNVAAVATLNNAIAAHTPTSSGSSVVTTSRLSDLVVYHMTTVGDGAPAMNTYNVGTNAFIDSLDRDPLGDNVWLFTDTYTQNSTDYRDIVVMSYDTALTGTDRHYWGLWMRQQTDTVTWDSINLFNFRYKSDEFQYSAHDGGALTGTATFTGGALGVYTKDAAAAGWFSADARLTANFGGDTVLDANKFTMTGTIDNFVLSGQESNNWSVTLADAPGKSSSGTGTDIDWTGTAAGGGAQNGAFSAVFTGRTSAAASRVIGTFIAHFSDGRAAGAFNATRGN